MSVHELTPAPEEEPAGLAGQRTRVRLADGREFVVRVTNRDFVAWDRTAARKKDWPGAQSAPFLFATFLAWSAARRDGLYDGPFDAAGGFCDQAEEVTPLQVTEEDTAPPTRRAAEPD